MQTYTCPTCGEVMQRDLTIFTEHTDRHIVDELKKHRPAWITEEGYCPKCLDFFKRSIQDPASAEALDAVNIGPREVRKRYVLAAIGLGTGLLMLFALRSSTLPRIWRLFIFLPFFAGALGFFQAKKRLCVVYAQKALKNMDGQEQPIANAQEAEKLRRRAKHLWVFSALTAAVLAAISLCGCETVKGVGRDIENVGSSVQHAMSKG